MYLPPVLEQQSQKSPVRLLGLLGLGLGLPTLLGLPVLLLGPVVNLSPCRKYLREEQSMLLLLRLLVLPQWRRGQQALPQRRKRLKLVLWQSQELPPLLLVLQLQLLLQSLNRAQMSS